MSVPCENNGACDRLLRPIGQQHVTQVLLDDFSPQAFEEASRLYGHPKLAASQTVQPVEGSQAIARAREANLHTFSQRLANCLATAGLETHPVLPAVHVERQNVTDSNDRREDPWRFGHSASNLESRRARAR